MKKINPKFGKGNWNLRTESAIESQPGSNRNDIEREKGKEKSSTPETG